MTQHADGREIIIVYDEKDRKYHLGLAEEGVTNVGRVKPIELTIGDLSDAKTMAGIVSRSQGRDVRADILYYSAPQGTDLAADGTDPSGVSD